MSRIVQTAGTLIGRRPTLFLGDFTPGDTPSIDRIIENVPATKFVSQAWITFKVNESDLDAVAVLQLAITGALDAAGQITDSGADGVAALSFTPSAAQTLLLTTEALHYDIAVALNDGSNYTIETGRFYSWHPPVNAWEGSRGNTGIIRVASVEPVEHQPRPYENELLDDVVGGDDYELRRLVYGLPAGRTVASASLVAVTTSAQADPGLFKIDILPGLTAGGQIVDTGSGVPRRADLRFVFTRAQTAQITTARGWRMRVTLDNGKVYTVLRGTLVARSDITDLTGSGAEVDHVVLTPDSFAIDVGQTQQLTAVAYDIGDTPIPGETFTWLSDNPAAATISATGLVTGIADGAALFRATANSNGIYDEGAGTIRGPIEERIPQSGLVNCWVADTGSGQVFVDKVAARDAQLGSTSGVDSNDPAWVAGPPKTLLFQGDDYCLREVLTTDTPTDYTYIVVLRVNAHAAATLYFLGVGDGVAGGLSPGMGILADLTWRVYNTNGPQAEDSGAFVLGTWYALYYARDNASGNAWKRMNNTQVLAPAPRNPQSVAPAPSIVFGHWSASSGGTHDTDIAAVIRYSRAITNQERIDIQNILRDYVPALPAGA